MDSIRNFRELGGLPVSGGTIRAGLLFRSGHLGTMSDDDAQRVLDLGIRTIVDLRSDNDIATEGADRVPDGVAHHRVPITDDAGRGEDLRTLIMRADLDELRERFGDGRGHEIARTGSVAFVEDPERQANFAEAMTIVADPDNWPLLWHCSGGKDRAGWIGTSVLLATGASTDTIVDHYVESNQALGENAWLGAGELTDLIRPFLGVHEDYVRGQLAAVDQQWGSGESLFRDGFGLDDGVVQRLRDALVAPASAS